MKAHLRSAVERFDKIKPKEFLINPISEVDCEIITELGEIFKKQGMVDIFEIIRTYKELKDEDILEQLQQWNIDHPNGQVRNLTSVEEKKIDEEPVKYAPYFNIGDLIFRSFDFKGLEMFERLDESGNYKYGVKINPTPDHAKQVPLYSNYCIEWFSEEDRNEVILKLKEVLEEDGIDFIDLNRTEDE